MVGRKRRCQVGYNKEVFQFGSVEICPTIKEYTEILGVHYDMVSIVSSLLHRSFNLRTSRPWDQEEPRTQKKEARRLKKCTLSLMCILFADYDALRTFTHG